MKLNQNTHYIDASNVYGSNLQVANELRLFKGGKLLYNTIGNETYCPQDPSKITQKGNHTEVTIAFLAGNIKLRTYLN